MKMLVLGTMAALMMGGAVAAQPSGSTPSAPTGSTMPPSAHADPNERVCVTQTQLGSSLARNRVCHTRAEWNRIQQEQRDATADDQRRGMQPAGQTPQFLPSPAGG